MCADFGVATGRSGTEVAKDAAKIVLVGDHFARLAAAVEEGCVVYGNIKKALWLLWTSFTELEVLLGAMALGYPLPFFAVQILWNNLLTEGLITVNLIMDPGEGDEAQRPPTPLDEPLVDRAMLGSIAVMVPAIVVVVLGWFVTREAAGVPAAQVRAEPFTLLALGEWVNVLNCRSAVRSSWTMPLGANPWLLGGLVLGGSQPAAVVLLPPLQPVLRNVGLGLGDVVLLVGVASVVLWSEELRKLVVRRRRRSAARRPFYGGAGQASVGTQAAHGR